MGTASTLGSVAAVATFGVGLYVGVNSGLPWPMAWASGITLGFMFSMASSAVFEYIDARKRYSFTATGTNLTRRVEEGVTVENCFSCSGADHDGVRVEWSKDETFLGLVTERHGGGISYYCSACHSDPIEAGLRAGRERQFRKRYDGADHYLDVLTGLRDAFLLLGYEGDFWAFVDGAMDRIEDTEGVDDPREYAEAVRDYHRSSDWSSFWSRVSERTGESKTALKTRYRDNGWRDYVKSADPFEPAERETEAAEATEQSL